MNLYQIYKVPKMCLFGNLYLIEYEFLGLVLRSTFTLDTYIFLSPTIYLTHSFDY